MAEISPIFLFSLPRAGSTLLQRMIAAHPQVATTAEPWLLLPCLDILEHRGCTFSTYGHQLALAAIREFAGSIEGEADILRQELRTMILNLYRHASRDNVRYFLDKTPRYHTHCETIVEMFPGAKFIVLQRHPLAVVASMLNTFADGKWYLYGNRLDLYDGLAALDHAMERFGERLLPVRYESLVEDPAGTMRQVSNYLELEWDEGSWDSFNQVDIAGKMKDPTGITRYSQVSSEPLSKWTYVFNNPFRIVWARRYLDWIGEERLSRMGYELPELHAELDALETGWRGVPGDLLRSGYGIWRTWRQADVVAAMGERPWKQRYVLR